jgi:uncharacterized protein (UPF0335 family)
MKTYNEIREIYMELKGKGYLTNYEAYDIAVKIHQNNLLNEANNLTIHKLETLEVISESLEAIWKVLLNNKL